MTFRILSPLAALIVSAGPAFAGTAAMPTTMAPLADYLMPAADEIALARSAAPAAISGGAEVMTLGHNGYETAVRGTNGFVCLVERAWTSPFDHADFWNPATRGPVCFNPAAAKSVLPSHIERTAWALAGLSREEMARRTKSSAAANTPPAAGAMSYMMSKNQVLSGQNIHWHPHVMFWVSRMPTAEWGANLKGSPVFGSSDGIDPVTTFYVPVGMWSDGTPATMEHHGS
jgi:hypothetical protein